MESDDAVVQILSRYFASLAVKVKLDFAWMDGGIRSRTTNLARGLTTGLADASRAPAA
jgi:hypothetical protein